MKKYIKVTYNNDSEKYIYLPEDPKGKFVPTGALEVTINEEKETLRAIAEEEFHLNEKAERIRLQEEIALLGNKKPPKLKTLFEAFDDPEKYQKMMKFLVDKELLEEHTYVFKDHTKGNKQCAVDLINSLFANGFFRRRLTHLEQKAILYNSLFLQVGLDWIKKPPSPVGSILKAPPYNIEIPLSNIW